MKKLLLILLLTIPFIGFGQKVLNYKSDFIIFSFYDTYTLDESSYYMEPSNKSVKLSCNSCNYGSLDNILITYLPIDGAEKINMPLLFKDLKKETESQGLKMGVNIDLYLVRMGAELIGDTDIPFFTYKMVMKDVETMFQKLYIYQTPTTTYQLILTTRTKEDLSKRQSDIDLILKTFEIKN